jgi:prepilin-type N-terminal cleavage/methylation domain-containing protein
MSEEDAAMLARIRKAQEKESGFTLIELLVVMIIIGILAAIAIPVFLNQRKKAQDSAAKADVSTLGKEVATYFVDNCVAPTIDTTTVTGRYTLKAAAATGANGCNSPAAAYQADLGKVSDNVTLVTAGGVKINDATKPDTTWCVDVKNAKGDKQNFSYSAADGLKVGGTC